MEEELIKRILPHSDDAERSVIGCMMMNREAIMIASEILTGDEFYRQQMGIVFDSMLSSFCDDTEQVRKRLDETHLTR